MAPDNIVSREGEAFATLARLLADHGRGAAMYGSGFSMHLRIAAARMLHGRQASKVGAH
jgi:hypothetical protein